MKRNLGHISAEALVTTLDLDLTRQVVNNWERNLGRSLQFQAKQWYIDLSVAAGAVHNGCERLVAWHICTARSDATSSSTSQSHQVHVCEITSTYFLGDLDDGSKGCEHH
jgi:hypothetical protein